MRYAFLDLEYTQYWYHSENGNIPNIGILNDPKNGILNDPKNGILNDPKNGVQNLSMNLPLNQSSL